MKHTKLLLLSACLVTQAQAFNLPKQAIKSYECDVCERLSHDSLQDKWDIADQPLNVKVSNAQRSYSYKQRISIEDLRAGVKLANVAPGAIIRIIPLQDKNLPKINIKTPSNKLMDLKEASSLYSEDESLGDVISKHQAMLQIKPELGAGRFTIQTNNILAKSSDAYMVSVLDKFSMNYLEVSTEALHYQFGDKVIAHITLKDDDNYDISSVEASLVSPSGQTIPLELTKLKNNQFQASAVLKSEANEHGANWYVEASIESSFGTNIIRRSGHTAFSYAVPSATLIHVKKLSSKPLTFVATLDVATPSRYALQSVLFRKAGNDSKSVETSQKSQWLDAGKQVIQFSFNNTNQLNEDNLYLGYLRLIDYGQLKTVYQYDQPIKLSKLVD